MYPKTVLDSSPGEDGFRNFFSMIFNDTYLVIRPVMNFRAINIDMKCKHLSNFAVVTPRVLC
jgi:hypothetical protein